MKKLLSIILSLTLFLSFFQIKNSLAQDSSSPILIASINIDKISYTKEDKQYNISFTLSNELGIQNDIRYGVVLINSKTNNLADLYLSNDVLTLKENEKRDLNIKYTIPNYIQEGEYILMIESQNSNGIPLARIPVDLEGNKIIITNSSNISISNCKMFLGENEAFDSIKPIEKDNTLPLNATCIINNETSSDKNNVNVRLITHLKTQFGDILNNNIIEKKISLKANSNTTVSFEIPRINETGDYSVDTFLIDSTNKKLTPSTYINYSISGIQIYIKNATLDKSSYLANSKALLNIFWSGRVNKPTMFKAKTTVLDENNTLCGKVETNFMVNNMFMTDTININIDKDCNNAIANIDIVDDDGNVVVSSNINQNIPTYESNLNITEINNSKYIYITAFFVILVIIGYGVLSLRKKTK